MILVPGSYLGPYQIVEQIGFGKMATEYKAHRSGVATFVAVKVVAAYFAEDAQRADRAREAALITSLQHPGLLKAVDYGEGHGAVFLVYEFVEGSSLFDRLGTPMTVAETVRILAPIAAALDYIHARSIIHRDVKPGNIMLARDGRTLLTDVGIARIADQAFKVAETGEVIGTPAYMAPEQATKEQVTRMTDEYALATVAYELITGQPPYVDENPMRVLMAHAQMPPPAASQVLPTVNPNIEKVLQRGLAKQPGDRYPSSTEFVDALREAERVVAAPKAAVAVAPLPVIAPVAAGGLGIWTIIAAAIGGALLIAIIVLAVVVVTSRNGVVAAAPTAIPTPARGAVVQAAVPTSTPQPTPTVAALVAPAPTARPAPTAAPAVAPTAVPQQPCQFLFGFKVLHDRIPDKVGNCADDETHNPVNGDALQHTSTKGLLVWRKADNWTAFTDGGTTWINGPGGNLFQRPNTSRFSWEPNPDKLPLMP